MERRQNASIVGVNADFDSLQECKKNIPIVGHDFREGGSKSTKRSLLKFSFFLVKNGKAFFSLEGGGF